MVILFCQLETSPCGTITTLAVQYKHYNFSGGVLSKSLIELVKGKGQGYLTNFIQLGM